MKKNRKKLKGMTLVEVLVALSIFTIMSSLLASSVLMVCSIVNKTDKLNTRISNEAPDAELKSGGVKEEDPTDPTIVINIGDTAYSVGYNKYVMTDKPENDYDGGNFKYITPK